MIGIQEVGILFPILECSVGIFLVVKERKWMYGSVFEALVWLYVWRSFERCGEFCDLLRECNSVLPYVWTVRYQQSPVVWK